MQLKLALFALLAIAAAKRPKGIGCRKNGLKRCGKVCADLQTDESHCGDCNTACAPGAETCVAGLCTATCSGKVCSGTCVDTQTDANNCGDCGKACPADHTCSNGACNPIPCTNGQHTIGGVCYDFECGYFYSGTNIGLGSEGLDTYDCAQQCNAVQGCDYFNFQHPGQITPENPGACAFYSSVNGGGEYDQFDRASKC